MDRDKHDLKNRYERLFCWVRTAVNKHDPIKLLARGAPADEYDAEVRAIVAGLGKCHNIDQLIPLLRRVFQENFESSAPVNEAAYRALAEDIYDSIAAG